MDTQADRLRWLLSTADMTPPELAKLTGRVRSSINHVLTGRNQMRLDAAVNIARVFGCPFEWLALGNGKRPAAAVVEHGVKLARRGHARSMRAKSTAVHAALSATGTDGEG